jgi:hypothetical protein
MALSVFEPRGALCLVGRQLRTDQHLADGAKSSCGCVWKKKDTEVFFLRAAVVGKTKRRLEKGQFSGYPLHRDVTTLLANLCQESNVVSPECFWQVISC